jgi:hypothetical protein
MTIELNKKFFFNRFLAGKIHRLSFALNTLEHIDKSK